MVIFVGWAMTRERQTEIWIDEKGEKVTILPFYTELFVDPEMERLNRAYKIWECNGDLRTGLGKAEYESAAARLLGLVRVGNANPPTLAGVKKSELLAVLTRSGDDWVVDVLIDEDLFREKWIHGDIVVFPTETLLVALKIPKR